MTDRPYPTDLPTLIDYVSEKLPGGRVSLGAELGVSDTSIMRWHNRRASPRPEIEGQLRAIADRFRATQEETSQQPLFAWPDESHDEQLRKSLVRTCRELREVFHRRARFSSRHEALDELAKLLFGHVMNATHGGHGISIKMLGTNPRPARTLRAFICDEFKKHTPLSLAHEMKPEDFALKIKDSETDLALEIIKCFSHLGELNLLESLRGTESVDVLNDAFGQFIADSFVQEKELGQYLTPTEVVRFMVRQAFHNLEASTRRKLLDPTLVNGAGLILDPSCGVGSFLTETLRVMYAEAKKTHGENPARELISKALKSNIVGIDKSERMLRLALTNLVMFGADMVNLHLANALARRGSDGDLTRSLEGKAVLILTNPPFGANFDRKELACYKLTSKWTRKPPSSVDSELLFLERYVDWLAPDGQLLAIVPDSVLTNRNIYEDLRSGLFGVVEIRSVVSLPSVTFGVAGTNTKTSVLHFAKKPKPNRRPSKVFFGVCSSLGYDVQTRGATRTKVLRGENQLVALLDAIQGQGEYTASSNGTLKDTDGRWDATYHAGLSRQIQRLIDENGATVLRVRDVATLSTDRKNPKRFGADKTFNYIEISDVDGVSLSVRSKEIPNTEAPSRARKRVRTGDVLVSTVRPERRTIGVVPEGLEGAICSTGFAVLRCHGIHPLILASLLRTDFVTAQLIKENSGIAYPTIEELMVQNVALPIARENVEALLSLGQHLEETYRKTQQVEKEFRDNIVTAVNEWMNA